MERCRPHGDTLGRQPWACEPTGFLEQLVSEGVEG